MLDQPLALRSLSGAGRSDEDDPHENPARDDNDHRHTQWHAGPVRAEPESGLLQQSGVVSHHEVTVDLLNQIEGHAHGDQQAGAAVESGNRRWNSEKASNYRGDNGNERKEASTDIRDPLHDSFEVIGRPLARAITRNEKPPKFLRLSATSFGLNVIAVQK